jgi:hypothetical protein
MNWKITHPRGDVKLFFQRKASCDKKFTCVSNSYTGNKPLFISCEDLATVFNNVWAWAREKEFASGCAIINEWGKNISGGGMEDLKRTTLIFSLHNNIESIDVRHWWRPSTEGVFMPSSNGFSISGRENITSFIKMGEEIENRLSVVEKLETLINRAYCLLFVVYAENYGVHPLNTPVINVLNIEKFTPLWNEAMKLTPLKPQDVKISAREIFDYIMQNEKLYLSLYIESRKEQGEYV